MLQPTYFLAFISGHRIIYMMHIFSSIFLLTRECILLHFKLLNYRYLCTCHDFFKLLKVFDLSEEKLDMILLLCVCCSLLPSLLSSAVKFIFGYRKNRNRNHRNMPWTEHKSHGEINFALFLADDPCDRSQNDP